MSRESPQALYRKYRSSSLEEVVGQGHITSILSGALKKDKVAHAYLFTGPRGVGKTSVARILAHEINHLPYKHEDNHIDIIEIDAASNNGVDDIRDLRDKVNIAPTLAKKKVYIIDEVHMLSKSAFNALLKTLEEPPAHVVFILATTDADKLPETIVSRTQQFTFRTISQANVVAHLRMIADKEKIAIENDALELIAERGGGSFRDSISLLDQLAGLSNTSKKPLNRSDLETFLGLASHEHITKLSGALLKKDQSTAVSIAQELLDNGISGDIIASQLVTDLYQTGDLSHAHRQLLSTLLDIPGAYRADVRLILAIAEATTSKPRHAVQTVATTPSLHIPALEKKAVEPIASKPVVATQKSDQVATSTPTQPTQEAVTSRIQSDAPTGTFEWQTFVTYMKEHHVATYSILTKCGARTDGNIITLYTGSAFYKKKLDDAKYLPILHQSLEAIGAHGYELVTVPEPAPLEDSQAAAVAAIMGGGEAVNLEDA